MSEKNEGHKFWALVHPGAARGIVTEEPKFKEQDAEAAPMDGYAVVFFPKITVVGNASLDYPRVKDTLSQTPEAAIAKFMDELAKSCKWETYHDAGHRVRKVRIIDLGDAEKQTPW